MQGGIGDEAAAMSRDEQKTQNFYHQTRISANWEWNHRQMLSGWRISSDSSVRWTKTVGSDLIKRFPSPKWKELFEKFTFFMAQVHFELVRDVTLCCSWTLIKVFLHHERSFSLMNGRLAVKVCLLIKINYENVHLMELHEAIWLRLQQQTSQATADELSVIQINESQSGCLAS